MEDGETCKETNPKKKPNKMKKDSLNSAKFWSKKWGKKVNKLKKGTENTKKWKKANTGERKRKKQRGPKNMFDLRVFFWCGIRFVELEPIFFGKKKKGVAKKWKKKTKWKLKQRNDWKCVLWWFVVHEIDNTLLWYVFRSTFSPTCPKQNVLCWFSV